MIRRDASPWFRAKSIHWLFLSNWYYEKLHALRFHLRPTLSQSDIFWLRYGTLIVYELRSPQIKSFKRMVHYSK